MPLDRHPEPGFRWARAVRFRARLTRDDHAYLTIYQARARGALVQGNIEPSAHRRLSNCRLLWFEAFVGAWTFNCNKL